MANQSEREDREEILSGSGLSEGHNWGEVMAGTIATQPPYSDDELMDMVQIIVYCFGFLSNISAIVVFFKEGLSTSSHIGFVSLALADLSVCTFCLIDSIGDWILHDYEFLQEFWWTIKLEENSATFSAWIVAVICWERLCEITFPEKFRRAVTPKFTTSVICGYLPFAVLEFLLYVVTSRIADHLKSTLCPTFYDNKNNVWRLNIIGTRMIAAVLAVREYATMILVWAPNLIAYGLVLVGSILAMCVRKPFTGEKEENNSAKKTRLTQRVFVVCLKFLLASPSRTIHRILIASFIKVDERNKYIKFYIHASYMLSAINHSTTFFIHLVLNSRFREIFCNNFLFKRHAAEN